MPPSVILFGRRLFLSCRVGSGGVVDASEVVTAGGGERAGEEGGKEGD